MGDSEAKRFEAARADRQRHVDAVLKSKSRNRIVVAGPGTGKTFLFKEVLRGKSSSLTLTFVNSLVEDLSLELCGLSDVRTLHSFARSVMSKTKGGARVYPKLSKIIARDLQLLSGEAIDFDSIFHKRDDRSPHIDAYKLRKATYGYYGFADMIYAAVRYLEENPQRIPAYDQVLVDEFQDFNQLEVSLIDLLAAKSPILIAGDDDQALYFFKDASHRHIRERYSEANIEYESFNLPHCSRCTRAIVEAANDIVASAQKEGFLVGRISKPYIFFEDERKELECSRYPKLQHVKCFSNQVPYFIEVQIRQLAQDRREKFSTLVIAPTKSRCRTIVRGLQQRGFKNVQYFEQQDTQNPSLLDALGLLSLDAQCNLGWRIAAEYFLSEDDLKSLLQKAESDKTKSLGNMLGDAVRKKTKELLKTFKKVAKGKPVSPEDSDELTAHIGIDPRALAREELRLKISRAEFGLGEPATRNIPIRVTTIPSSKGLADDYVFITDFDDRFYLAKGGQCSDQKIFDFLVALTRARRCIYLISAEKKDPKFLTWIAPDRVDRIEL